ncbi:MAG: P1 family peptidase [Ilumatobacter sp.]|nr:P1 family peptidase [Ilumatobacter sp.]
MCDVAGLRVGHHQRTGRGWQTGTTVVFAPEGAVAAVDVRGGGPGTRETDALDARNLVDRVHGICLTGGSAYGLAAAHGVAEALERRHLGVQVGPEPSAVVPVVPAAVIFDLGRGGDFTNRPDAGFGNRALATADRSSWSKRGSVGAGTGARAGGIQGGVGMASTTVELAAGEGPPTLVTVAALAVVNSSGFVIDPATGAPWVKIRGLRRPSRDDRTRLGEAVAAAHAAPLNTTIGVVASDAALSRAETGRLAQSAHDGLARAVRPAHSLMDGDTVFGLATAARDLPVDTAGIVRAPTSRAVHLNALFAAAADVFALACADAVVTAETVGSTPSYRELCPSAWPG